MSWRPERGWFSVSARAVIAAGGVVVLAAGLTTVPTSLVPDSPNDSTVDRLGSDGPRASRLLIGQEPTRVGERDAAAAAAGVGVDAPRLDGQPSEGSPATTDRAAGTANDVAPAPSTGGAPESSSSGSSGGSAPSEPDHSGSDDPAVPESSGEGANDESDDTSPDDTSPDDTDAEGGDSPGVSGGNSENGDDES